MKLQSFTKEDLKAIHTDICNHLESKEFFSYSDTEQTVLITLKKALELCNFNAYQLSVYDYGQYAPDLRALNADIEELPLLINDEDTVVKILAKWRLKKGE